MGRAPASGAPRGSFYGERYVCQFAARFPSLVFLLVSMGLTPTTSYGNRVMITEAVARLMEARHRVLGAGSNERWEVEKYDSNGTPRSSGAALDNVVGAIVFGIAANRTRDDAGMLQVRLGGVPPDVGENHFASPPDYPPRPALQGHFAIDKEVRPEDRVATCEDLVNEWGSLDVDYARGVRTGHARWLPGCPVRMSCGGVGGNRVLALTPGPVS